MEGKKASRKVKCCFQICARKWKFAENLEASTNPQILETREQEKIAGNRAKFEYPQILEGREQEEIAENLEAS